MLMFYESIDEKHDCANIIMLPMKWRYDLIFKQMKNDVWEEKWHRIKKRRRKIISDLSAFTIFILCEKEKLLCL